MRTTAAAVAAAVAAVMAQQLAHADAFRWVDESGGVHYGDSPPEGVSGQVTELEVYECDTLECLQREALRAEQAREEVRRLEESFPKRPAVAAPSPQGSYVNTVVREVYVTPFAVPALRHRAPVPYLQHRRATHRGFSAGFRIGGRHGFDGGHGGGSVSYRGSSGSHRSATSMSMPRY